MNAHDTHLFRNATQIAEPRIRQARSEQAQLLRNMLAAALRLAFGRTEPDREPPAARDTVNRA